MLSSSQPQASLFSLPPTSALPLSHLQHVHTSHPPLRRLQQAHHHPLQRLQVPLALLHRVSTSGQSPLPSTLFFLLCNLTPLSSAVPHDAPLDLLERAEQTLLVPTARRHSSGAAEDAAGTDDEQRSGGEGGGLAEDREGERNCGMGRIKTFVFSLFLLLLYLPLLLRPPAPLADLPRALPSHYTQLLLRRCQDLPTNPPSPLAEPLRSLLLAHLRNALLETCRETGYQPQAWDHVAVWLVRTREGSEALKQKNGKREKEGDENGYVDERSIEFLTPVFRAVLIYATLNKAFVDAMRDLLRTLGKNTKGLSFGELGDARVKALEGVREALGRLPISEEARKRLQEVVKWKLELPSMII